MTLDDGMLIHCHWDIVHSWTRFFIIFSIFAEFLLVYIENYVQPCTVILIIDNFMYCGYIYIMKDRKRNLNKMVHIRFTDDERKQLKAISALEGKSIQEYVRTLVIKDIDKKRIK